MRNFLLLFVVCCSSPSVAMAQSRHGDGLDDAMRYTSYAAVFALKAIGADSRHGWAQLSAEAAVSWVAAAGTGYILKHNIREWRPDSTDMRSFPSGHTLFAFAGATILRHEFGHLSPWISIGGYTVAALTAIDRVRRDRHHWHDVVAGAAVGICTAELTCFLSDRLLKTDRVRVGVNPAGVDVAVCW